MRPHSEVDVEHASTASPELELLFRPLRVRPGTVLANRIVMAPVFLGNRTFTREGVEFFRRRALGGAGSVVVPVPTMGGLTDLERPEFRAWARRIVPACVGAGCAVIPQVFSGPGEHLSALPASHLETLPGAFARAAVVLAEAGFRAFEIHGAHHSLFMHLLLPALNRRDTYGTLEDRTRVQLETVRAVKQATGRDLCLFFRLSVSDLAPGGTGPETTVPYAQRLEAAGVDVLDCSAGGTQASPKWSDCPDRSQGDGCFVPLVARVKAAVSVPVIAAGRIRTGALAAAVLGRGQADAVALCRGLVADPEWPAKVREGRDGELVPMDEWQRFMPGRGAA